MILGESEGLDQIYDKNGDIILDADEQHIDSTNGSWLGYYLKEGLGYKDQFKSGYGHFTITSSRLIYLRESLTSQVRAPMTDIDSNIAPSPYTDKLYADAHSKPYSIVPSPYTGYYKKLKKTQYGVREFFVIRLEEIKKIKVDKTSAKIYGKDENKKYLIEIEPYVGEKLKELMK